MTTRAAVRSVGMFFGRSFFPFAALAVILGAMLWGPFVSLAIALVLWRVVGRVA